MRDVFFFTDEGTAVVLNGKNIAMVSCNPQDKTLVVHTADGTSYLMLELEALTSYLGYLGMFRDILGCFGIYLLYLDISGCLVS